MGFRSAVLQFAALAFDQELQLIQQLRVMGAERLHQIREWQRGSVARPSNCRMLSIAVTRCSSSAVWRGYSGTPCLRRRGRAGPSYKDGRALSSPWYSLMNRASASSSRTVALPCDQTSCINRCSNGPSRGLETDPKIENDFVIRKRGKTCARPPEENTPSPSLWSHGSLDAGNRKSARNGTNFHKSRRDRALRRGGRGKDIFHVDLGG